MLLSLPYLLLTDRFRAVSSPLVLMSRGEEDMLNVTSVSEAQHQQAAFEPKTDSSSTLHLSGRAALAYLACRRGFVFNS